MKKVSILVVAQRFFFFLSFGTKVFSTKHLDYSTVNIHIVVRSMSYGIKLKRAIMSTKQP